MQNFYQRNLKTLSLNMSSKQDGCYPVRFGGIALESSKLEQKLKSVSLDYFLWKLAKSSLFDDVLSF